MVRNAPVVDTTKSILLGTGGHARVLVDCLRSAGAPLPVGALARMAGEKSFLEAIPILGTDELLPFLRNDGIHHFIVGVGSTANLNPRSSLYQRAMKAGLKPINIRHPSAIISTEATVGLGVQLMAGCIVNANAVLNENVLINSGAIVEHDCIIEAHSHIATGARLAGGVRVCSGVHVGVGAIIRQGITIHEGAVVGAGAVVVRDVATNTVVIGVPAKFLRNAGD